MKKKIIMKIIVVGPSYEDYTAASYQNEFMKELRNLSESYYHYKNKGDITITELISYSKFTPDIIFYNHGWLSDNVNLEDIKYLRLILFFLEKYFDFTSAVLIFFDTILGLFLGTIIPNLVVVFVSFTISSSLLSVLSFLTGFLSGNKIFFDIFFSFI